MLLALSLACIGPSPLVGETVTDGGSWGLTLAATEYDEGESPVDMLATRLSDGIGAEGLTVYARPGMDAMDHALDLVDFVEAGGGGYTARVVFDMPGLWTLTGYAGDAAVAEGFTFVVEVLP